MFKKKKLKGTVNVISRNPPLKELHAHFITVPLNPLSDQTMFLFFKFYHFYLWFLYILTLTTQGLDLGFKGTVVNPLCFISQLDSSAK